MPRKKSAPKVKTSVSLSEDSVYFIEKLKAMDKYFERNASFFCDIGIKLLAEREGITLPRPKP